MDKITSNISTLYAEDNIAVLTLENGAKNLLTEPEFIEKNILVSFLNKHPEVNALVIRGKGRHFSHGADVSLFSEESTRDDISEKLEKARELLRTIERLPVLTVAAINGGCFGGGLEIALSCQFRIASPKAYLGLTEIIHGVVPGMGGMERLQRLLGRQTALRMCMNGEMITAQKAMECGLITAVSNEKDAFPESMEFVRSLAEGKSNLQIACILETMNNALDGAEDPSKGQFERVLAEINKG
ncbi:MAG: enoyl-CoA hydratase/isomerase family protein [Oscillospiraceae bacterium]|nr:enoyl-CoA hydratase/isomerase family protein [Oscillospiraceae bacterium]